MKLQTDYFDDFDGAQRKTFDAPRDSLLSMGFDGKPRMVGRHECYTAFDLLPAAAVAAGTDKLFLSVGVGTEVISRAANGGCNVQTQASTPAADDDAMLAAVATTRMCAILAAARRTRFEAMASITTITTTLFSIGLNENVTDPRPSGTAGDGAMFLFDPDQLITTGLSAAQHANWICTYKVNGTDYWFATNVEVVAGRNYHFEIKIGADLKPTFYIDGVEMVAGTVALTSGDTVKAYAGIETQAAAQRDFTVCFMAVDQTY